MTDLQDTAQVRNPRLLQAAQAETKKEIPDHTRMFWKKALSTYLRLGGKLEPTTPTEDER